MNIKKRGNRLYIDYCKNAKRIRMATGLKANAENKEFVKKHFKLFLEDKTKALLMHKDFVNALFDKQNEPNLPKRCKVAEFDISNLLEKIIKEKSFLKPFTLKNNQSNAKTLLSFLDSRKLCDIRLLKREHCVEYVGFLKQKGFKNGTLKNKMAILHQLLQYALFNGFIDKNPYFMPKMSDEASAEIKPFSLDEMKILINNSSGELKRFLILAFFTGMRTGELFGLKMGDINFKKDEIHIQRTKHPSGAIGTPKTKNSNRFIDMLPLVKKELESLKKGENDFIFTLSRTRLKQQFDELLKNLNLQKRRLYDTRHSFASVMLSQGEEAMWVGVRMLGHKNLTMTFKAYAKYMPENVGKRALFLKDFENEAEQITKAM